MDTPVLTAATFDQADLLAAIDGMDDAALDELPFGVIGIDREGIARRYSATESRLAGLRPERVVGMNFFGAVAQCMNNERVSGRFEACLADGSSLDVTLDYVLTLRMKPTKVKMRLLAGPAHAMRYVCILR